MRFRNRTLMKDAKKKVKKAINKLSGFNLLVLLVDAASCKTDPHHREKHLDPISAIKFFTCFDL